MSHWSAQDVPVSEVWKSLLEDPKTGEYSFLNQAAWYSDALHFQLTADCYNTFVVSVTRQGFVVIKAPSQYTRLVLDVKKMLTAIKEDLMFCMAYTPSKVIGLYFTPGHWSHLKLTSTNLQQHILKTGGMRLSYCLGSRWQLLRKEPCKCMHGHMQGHLDVSVVW